MNSTPLPPLLLPLTKGESERGILIFCSLLYALCSPLQAVEISRMRYVMGTLLQIQVQAKDEETAEKAIESGFQEVERLEQLLSNWKEDSEISRINREAYPNGTPVSEEMVLFLSQAKHLSDRTKGFFDITIEPLTKLWKLRAGKLEKIPSKEEIERAKSKVNYKNLEISASAKTVRFLVEGMGIDTGGIGKGFALDMALEKIKEFPIQSATLNFGGQILYLSGKPKKKKVAIKNPLKPDKVWKKITLAKCSQFSASTTGNYEKFTVVNAPSPSSSPSRGEGGGEGKKKLGHILNPKTGMPVETPLRSVTVISKNAMKADAYSTAIFAMPLQEGIEFTNNREEIGVINLYETQEEKLIAFKSKGYKEWAALPFIHSPTKQAREERQILKDIEELTRSIFMGQPNQFNIGVGKKNANNLR